MFLLMGLKGFSKEFFGAGNRNILQAATEAIQRSTTLGMFDRANVRGTRSPQERPSGVKGRDLLFSGRGDLRSLGKDEKGGDE